MSDIVKQIFREAERQKLAQKELASAVGVPPESLSRIKKRSTARLEAVEQLAEAVGMRLTLSPSRADKGKSSSSFRQKHSWLAWSNPQGASDTVYLRKALLDPDFTVLLAAATEFGVDRLEAEWRILNADTGQLRPRIAAVTSRMLRHIRNGYEKAAA